MEMRDLCLPVSEGPSGRAAYRTRMMNLYGINTSITSGRAYIMSFLSIALTFNISKCLLEHYDELVQLVCLRRS